MTLPSTQKQWVVEATDKGFDGLVYQKSAPIPKPGDNEVLVRLRGASLNFRDLIIPQGTYPFPLNIPVVAGSDGAGEVVAVGAGVTKWRAGDRVLTLFNQAHQAGPITPAATASGLGGCLDGTLREYAVFRQDGVVRMPKNLGFMEAASLVCAGLTAWNCLYGLRPVRKGDTVLVQGTGGVSLFGLQFAKAAGATVVATTSSAEKAELLKKLGADHVVNYREDPNWGVTARKLTPNGEGFDHILELGGKGTLSQSLEAIKLEGLISIIGVLGGVPPPDPIIQTLVRICTVRGVYVGSREQLEEMVKAIEEHDIRPVMDKTVFTLDQVKEAYEYMLAQKHVGKIGINIE